MPSVLDSIPKCPDLFTLSTIHEWRPESERIVLEDPLHGVFLDLFYNLRHGTAAGERERSALRWSRKARHYFDNLILLLSFVLNDLNEYRNQSGKHEWPERLRLSLDLEKLLSDTRSLLDVLYRLTLFFQVDLSGIPRKRQDSFGRFAEWHAYQGSPPLPPPLQHLCEVVPWALDIRALRDGYVHDGHESLVFYGANDLFLDPHAHRPPPRPRTMPDAFYDPENPNNLIIVEKFLVYIVAPVLSVRRALGEELHSVLAGSVLGWQHYSIGMPFQRGPGVVRMRDWLRRNKDVLDPAYFRQRWFAARGKGS